MVIHKRTRLTPIQRDEICRIYHGEGEKVSEDKTRDSVKVFLEQVLEECPYTI